MIGQDRYDPLTGERIPNKKFDPNTGEIIEEKYDPYTGDVIKKDSDGLTAKVILRSGDVIDFMSILFIDTLPRISESMVTLFLS